jgi:hypothetical protein
VELMSLIHNGEVASGHSGTPAFAKPFNKNICMSEAAHFPSSLADAIRCACELVSTAQIHLRFFDQAEMTATTDQRTVLTQKVRMRLNCFPEVD